MRNTNYTNRGKLLWNLLGFQDFKHAFMFLPSSECYFSKAVHLVGSVVSRTGMKLKYVSYSLVCFFSFVVALVLSLPLFIINP